MKRTLAMIVKNEEPMLRKTLPIMTPLFNEVVVVDTGSTDWTIGLLKSFNAIVHEIPWNNNYSQARNAAIELALGSQSEAIFMFDADEAITASGLLVALDALETNPAISLPRIEFVFDLEHYNPDLWPDYQCRFFRADASPRFVGAVHEFLTVGSVHAHEIARKVDVCPIYHYGQTKPLAETVLRHHNYGRIAKGLPPVRELPLGTPLVLHHRSVPYAGSHPLLPIDKR